MEKVEYTAPEPRYPKDPWVHPQENTRWRGYTGDRIDYEPKYATDRRRLYRRAADFTLVTYFIAVQTVLTWDVGAWIWGIPLTLGLALTALVRWKEAIALPVLPVGFVNAGHARDRLSWSWIWFFGGIYCALGVIAALSVKLLWNAIPLAVYGLLAIWIGYRDRVEANTYLAAQTS